MPRTQTFTPQHASEARRLFDIGFGCRAIATELGFSPARISKWAKAEGLSFDRAQTAAATTAKAVDLAALRAELATEMGLAAKELLGRRNDPYIVYSFGGAENTYNEHELERPPVEAIRNIVTTAGIAFDKATKFLEKDTSGVETAHSLLDTLAAGFTAAAATYETPTDTVE